MGSGSRGQGDEAELARWRRTVARLPLTLRPSVNQQLDEWEMLFPFEQGTLRRFLCGVESLSTAEFNALMAPLRRIEDEMGVERWNFSETANTMENSAHLARSSEYAEWRSAVKQIFATVESQPCAAIPEPRRGRVIVTIYPASLPMDALTAWTPWKATGRLLPVRGDAHQLCDLLQAHSGIGALAAGQTGGDPGDAWWIDAGTWPDGAGPSDTQRLTSGLSYERLNPFRQEFLAALNTVPRDTHIASETLVALKRRSWSHSWPDSLGDERLRNFVVDLYLSGNGALIFPNSFAQWAASEALRRARPQILVARFGLRNRPKPFTSIAIFENQSRVSTLPDVPDPVNSAVDAAILGWYVWLSTLRYVEYKQALCMCISEHLNAVWVVAPPGSDLAGNRDSVSPEELYRAIAHKLDT